MEKRWFKTKTHSEPVALINPSQRLVRKAVARWRDLKMRADNTTALTILIDPPGPRKEEVVRRERHGRHLELVDGYSRTDYIIQNIGMLRDLINTDDSDSSAPESASPRKLPNVTNGNAAKSNDNHKSASDSTTPKSAASTSGATGSGSSAADVAGKSSSSSSGEPTTSGAKHAGRPKRDAENGDDEDGEAAAPERRTRREVERRSRGDSPRENREPEEAAEEDDKYENGGDGQADGQTDGQAVSNGTSARGKISATTGSIKPPLSKKCDNSTAGTTQPPRLKRSDNLVSALPANSVEQKSSKESSSISPLGFSTPPLSSRTRGRATATAKSRPSLPANLAAIKTKIDPNESQDDLDEENQFSADSPESESQDKRINTRSVTKDNLPIGKIVWIRESNLKSALKLNETCQKKT